MNRLLIVDDEEIIVNSLYEIFNNMTNLDLDVYKAYSGEEAIDWLNRTRIDIVLTDIRMPEIDGLQLLDEIHRSWPQCKVIFLTGYNEFEYVYKAIQHNSVSYILKTEDHEKVIDVVEKAIVEIKKEIKMEDLIHKAKEQMNIARDMFQKDYFIHLLQEDTSLNINQSQFEQLGVPMHPEHPVILLVGQVDNIPSQLSYSEKIQYLNSVRLIISKYLSTHIIYVIVMDERYRFVLFIQPKELLTMNQIQTNISNCYVKTTSFLKGTLEVIQTACRESLSASISFAMSGKPCSWEVVSKKYYSLKQLLNYKIGEGIEMILVDNEFKNNYLYKNITSEIPELEADTETFDMEFGQKKLDMIEVYLESGQSDKFFEIVSELMNPLKSIKSKNSSMAIETYYKVALCLLSYINRWKLIDKIAFHIGLHKLIRIDMHNSWEAAVEYIFALSKIIFNLQREEPRKRADNAIYSLEMFIENHLSEDLTLVRLAEHVYLNPSYLSRLYKEVTGTNLSNFIDNTRIKKAKELLEEENVKIYDVARSVGYETASSFNRFFRRMTGCSPQEYYEAFLKVKKSK